MWYRLRLLAASAPGLLLLFVASCSTEVGPEDRQAFDRHHQEGLRCLQAGQLVDACNELRRAAAEWPGNAQVHFELGLALSSPSSEQSFARAIDAFRRARELGLDSAQLAYALGRALGDQDRFDEAIAELEPLTREPGDLRPSAQIDLRILLASMHLQRNELEPAAGLLAEARELLEALPARSAHPGSPRVRLETDLELQVGSLAYRRREWEPAARAFEAVVARDPESRKAHHHLVRVYLRLERPEDSEREQEIQELLTAVVDNFGLEHRRDTAHLSELYLRLHELMPDYHLAWSRIAGSHEWAGEYAEAVAACQRGLAEVPEDRGWERAHLHLAMGSARHLEAGQERDPERRLQLLRQAGRSAARATELAPGLRAQAMDLAGRIQESLSQGR